MKKFIDLLGDKNMKEIKLNKKQEKLLSTTLANIKDHENYSNESRKAASDLLDQIESPFIEVYGRRWFQKSYGNTYNSVRIYVDGVEVAFLPFNYGYGDHYRTVAQQELEKLGILPDGASKLAGYELREKFNIKYSVEDVDRKKDL